MFRSDASMVQAQYSIREMCDPTCDAIQVVE